MNYEIINGKRINIFYLGWTKDHLIRVLDQKYIIEQREKSYVLITDQYMFWFDDHNDRLYQILVYGSYKGEFKKHIGIGSTLSDIKMNIGEYKEKLDYYILIDYPGICFELEGDTEDDNEEWDELSAPIKYISIYNE